MLASIAKAHTPLVSAPRHSVLRCIPMEKNKLTSLILSKEGILIECLPSRGNLSAKGVLQSLYWGESDLQRQGTGILAERTVVGQNAAPIISR